MKFLKSRKSHTINIDSIKIADDDSWKDGERCLNSSCILDPAYWISMLSISCVCQWCVNAFRYGWINSGYVCNIRAAETWSTDWGCVNCGTWVTCSKDIGEEFSIIDQSFSPLRVGWEGDCADHES